MEELYKEHANLVYNYLSSLCKNSELAEELTQETFYKAVKSIKKFHNECKVSTWLCQIAKNTWIDFLRKEKKSISIDDENFPFNLAISGWIEENEDKEDLINLYKNIHKLDEDVREVFYLRLKGEFSFKEISAILNKTEEWTRLAFYRGKIKLKETMNEKRV